jgi:hypothetical protein
MMTLEEIQAKRDRLQDFQMIAPVWEQCLILKQMAAVQEEILAALQALIPEKQP